MKGSLRIGFSLCILFCAFFYSSGAFALTPLKAAWEPWAPYAYLNVPSLQSSVTGLDIELLRLFAEEAQASLSFQHIPADQTLEALQKGQMDLATGASYSPEWAQSLYYSKPYRSEQNALFVLQSKEKLYPFTTVSELLGYIKQHHFRLGVIKGISLVDPELNSFVSNPQNASYLVKTTSDAENLSLLLDNTIDGFIADRVSGAYLIWQAKLANRVSEHYLPMSMPIYLVFSRKTVSEKTVADFNQAITKVRGEAIYSNYLSWYLYPVIMLQTTEKEWFKALDLLGTISFSISGVLIAYFLRKSFIAALVYAILPCLLGGILRDVTLGHKPVEALETPEYLLLICCLVFVGHFSLFALSAFMRHERYKHHLHFLTKLGPRVKALLDQALIIFDALGLSTLAVSGVMISLMARVQPLWLWGPFFSFLTASLGTIVRDILSKNERLEDVVGELYSEVGIAWGLFLSVAIIFNADNIEPLMVQKLILITVAGCFITRLLVHYLKVPNVYFR